MILNGKEPERIYYTCVLGMLVSLSNDYDVKSNKESGYGRYAHIKKCDSTTTNLMIIPKDSSKIGIVPEKPTSSKQKYYRNK